MRKEVAQHDVRHRTHSPDPHRIAHNRRAVCGPCRAASGYYRAASGRCRPGNRAVPPGCRTAPAASPTASPRASSPAGEPASAADRPLFREADQEKLALRLQQAVTEFVENPTRAVEEAEGAFDAAVDGLAHALKERRREMDVQQQGRESGTRTEELRIVLQQYRDLTERLLKV